MVVWVRRATQIRRITMERSSDMLTFMSALSVVTRVEVMSSCWMRSRSCFSREPL